MVKFPHLERIYNKNSLFYVSVCIGIYFTKCSEQDSVSSKPLYISGKA